MKRHGVSSAVRDAACILASSFVLGHITAPMASAQQRHELSGAQHFQDLARAGELLATGKSTEALVLYERLASNEPRDGDLWIALAQSAQAAGNADKAITAYNRALETGFSYSPATRWSSRPSVMRELARIHARAGRTDQALRWLDSAVAAGDWVRASFNGYERDATFQSLTDNPQFRRIAGLPPAGNWTRTERWRHDLDFYIEQARRLHVAASRPAFSTLFDSTAARIRNSIPTLSDDEIVTGIRRLAVILGDGHEIVYPNPERGEKLVPVNFYFFDDGLHIIGGTGEGVPLVGKRVLGIGARSTDEIVARMRDVVTGDNPIGVAWDGAPQLSMMWMLRALGAADDSLGTTITVAEGATRRTFRLNAVSRMLPGNRLTSPAGAAPVPLFLSRPDDNYWIERVAEPRALYFHFGATLSKRDESIGRFASRLSDSLRANDTRDLIVDLRRNSGGDATIVADLVGVIAAFAHAAPDHRVWVLTGRTTASAAVDFLGRVMQVTRPILVGEPTAAGPNYVGEAWTFRLPFSRTLANVSYRYHQSADWLDSRRWFVPQVPVEYLAADYFGGKDPVMTTVLELIGKQR